jgi:hypothetical protein
MEIFEVIVVAAGIIMSVAIICQFVFLGIQAINDYKWKRKYR